MRMSLRSSWLGPMGLGVALGAALMHWGAPSALSAQEPAKSCPERAAFGVFAQALELLEQEYIRPLDRQKLLQAAVTGMTSVLDPHTVYLDPSEANLLREEIDGAFGGVGLVVNWEPQWLDAQGKVLDTPPQRSEPAPETPHRILLRVKSVVPDSPASRAKLMPNDAIVEIQGRAIAQFPHLGQAVMQMRGPVGTPVRFKVQRGKREFEVKVDRGRVKTFPVVTNALGDGVLHVRLREFSAGVTQALAETLNQFPDHKIVLDLRDNGGGLLSEAVGIADLFVSKGVLVRTRGRNHRELEQRSAHRIGTHKNTQLVLLINKATASASEILAGALQDHRRALVVGERSYGKGSVQIPYGLADGGMLKTTVALYYTPNDRVIQARGISPDLWVSAKAPEFVDSRPGLKSERDSPLHLRPDGHSTSETRSELESKETPAARESLRASQKDSQLRAAVEYLLAAQRIGGR